ncbi:MULTISPECIES: MlaD family protein [Sphingomonas]|uniref:MlaD family protein n=1 Tax=Sphingomonas TaxID=13687 RepID=UPI000F7EA7D0|nr:MlaD family protein [Sphingomonas sp. ABOLF]RSV12333.1 MCE family protein [Sphingomonas sp. ABOLF]GLK20564.1 ABC transporter substrate-binding protein [Microbacterium terregens]
MERHANYALVGAISVLLIISSLVFVVWLGGSRFNQQYDQYRIIFHGPVRGLSVGAEVQFNGIKFGQIDRIRLSEQDPNQVITDITLTHGTPVRVDSMASTESQGISGVSIVQISAGTPSKPLLRESRGVRRPVIMSKPNALSSILQGGGEVLQSAAEALGRVNRILSDRNITNLSGAVQDIRTTAGEIAANRAMITSAASALAKLDRAATDFQETAASARQIVDGDGRHAFADVSAAAGEFKTAVSEARGVIATLNAQSSEVGTTTVPAINSTMLSLQEAAESLDGLIRQIRQSPRQMLSKDSGKELELPQ